MTTLTNRTPQEEHRAQQRLLDIADRRFAAEIERIVAAASEQMLADFAATGSAPQMPQDFPRQMEQAYTDMAATMIDAFGERILGQGKSMGLILETKDFAEFFQRLALEYIAQESIRRRIAGVTNTTRDLIISAITKGQEAGDSVDVISKRITDLIPRMSRLRGSIIARTETHGAANFGADQAARATGLTLEKEWVASHDHRTRDFGQGDGVVDEFSHRAADGQKVAMDQPFRIPKRDGTTEALMFPGDPNGSAANVINCRCTVAHVVKDF